MEEGKMMMEPLTPQWHRTGGGLRLEAARNVADAHGVPLEVAFKVRFVDALDWPKALSRELDGVEDHVIIDDTWSRDGSAGDVVKAACEARTRGFERPRGKVTVVVVSYADLSSCAGLEEDSGKTTAAALLYGYIEIAVVNHYLLMLKKNGMAQSTAYTYRLLRSGIESLHDRILLFAAGKHSKKAHGALSGDRAIAKERRLLMDPLINEGCLSVDPCGGSSSDHHSHKQLLALLPENRQELDEEPGAFGHPELEAHCKFKNEMSDARMEDFTIIRRVSDVLDRVGRRLKLCRMSAAFLDATSGLSKF